MTYTVRHTYGIQCARSQVQQLLRDADPEATANRRSRRLVSSTQSFSGQ